VLHLAGRSSISGEILGELHAAEGDDRSRLADTVSRLFLRQSTRQPGSGEQGR
jgi:glutamyl-tRNA reductase